MGVKNTGSISAQLESISACSLNPVDDANSGRGVPHKLGQSVAVVIIDSVQSLDDDVSYLGQATVPM